MSKYCPLGGNEYNPDKVTPPSETILETMKAQRLTSTDMVLFMMPLLEPEQTEALLRGEVVITEEIAIQLEAALDVPAQFWLNRQRRYDANSCNTRKQRNL